MERQNGSPETSLPNDRAALEGLFRSHMPQLYRLADRILQNPQDSEDAVQNGLLLAFLHIDQFQGRSQLSTWLYSIIKNSARTHLRTRGRRHMTLLSDEIPGEEGGSRAYEILHDPRPTPEEECARTEGSRMLRDKLKYLPSNYRSVVQMCIVEGRLQREVARELGISVGAVKARLHRACALLTKSRGQGPISGYARG